MARRFRSRSRSTRLSFLSLFCFAMVAPSGCSRERAADDVASPSTSVPVDRDKPDATDPLAEASGDHAADASGDSVANVLGTDTAGDHAGESETQLTSLPNLTPDDWAFIPATYRMPDRFACLDPGAELVASPDGLHVIATSNQDQHLLVFRSRLDGDFRFELELAAGGPPGTNSGMIDLTDGSRRLPRIEIGFQFDRQNHSPKMHNVPSPRDGAGAPVSVILQREGNELTYELGKFTRSVDLPEDVQSGYLALSIRSLNELVIRRAEWSGDSGAVGFARPKLQAAEMHSGAWSKSITKSTAQSKIEQVILSFSPGSMRFVNTVGWGEGFARYDRQFQGDFYVRAKLVFGNASHPSTRRRDERTGIQFGISTPDNPGRGLSFPLKLPEDSNESLITIARVGSSVWSSAQGLASVKTFDGPVHFQLRSKGQDHCELNDMQVFSDRGRTVEKSAAPTIAASGWAVDTTSDAWHPSMAERILIETDSKGLRVQTDQSGSGLPLERAFPETGDFEVSWTHALPSLDRYARNRERGTPVLVRVRQKSTSTPHATISLPLPDPESDSEHAVVIRRQGDSVTVSCADKTRQQKLQGPLKVELRIISSAMFWVADYRQRDLSRGTANEPPTSDEPPTAGEATPTDVAEQAKEASQQASPTKSSPDDRDGHAKLRTWSDPSGKYTFRASFIRKEGDQIHLKGADGRDVVVPRGKLSPADQEYLDAISAESDPR